MKNVENCIKIILYTKTEKINNRDKMYKYKLSVIIPTYNSSNTIGRLIHSLINQDFKDFEIIFIDDKSEDNTLEIIKNTIKNKNLSYQIILNKSNKGPGYSRNIGIKFSKGKYLVFVDSDDIINFNHLSSLYDSLKNNDTESVFTKGVKLDGKDKLFNFQIDKYDPILKLVKSNNMIIKAEDLIKLELEMKIPFSFVLLIYDKEIILNNDLKFDEKFRYGEDTIFALKYLSNCNHIKINDKYTYFYYQNQESISNTSSFHRFEAIKLFEELTYYFNLISEKKPIFKELNNKLIQCRIPRFIFGNMNYFFYNDYNKEEVFKKMNELDLFNKLKNFKIYEKRDMKFFLKVKLFLINPHLYYALWKKLKNRI